MGWRRTPHPALPLHAEEPPSPSRGEGRERVEVARFYARLLMVYRKTGAADAGGHFLRYLGNVPGDASVADRSGRAGAGTAIFACQPVARSHRLDAGGS